jgi:hypothetical protein
VDEPNIEISYDDLLNRYINNPITEAIVLQGLEPLDSWSDVIDLILWLRIKYHCEDDIVIYTGYKEEEIEWFFKHILPYEKINKNIIVKFGRYIPNQEPHFDEVLGVKLSSDNQYAKKIC